MILERSKESLLSLDTLQLETRNLTRPSSDPPSESKVQGPNQRSKVRKLR